MSFEDDLIINEEGREEVEQVATLYSRIADTTDGPFGAQMVLGAAVVAEFLLLAVTFFGILYLQFILTLNIVLSFALGLFAAFTIGFFSLFSVYKIYKNEISQDEDIHIDTGVMSCYADEENSRRQFAGWLFGAAGAIVNTAIWIGVLATHV
jgi:hypothetical protein